MRRLGKGSFTLTTQEVPKSLLYKVNSWCRKGACVPLTIQESRRLLRYNFKVDSNGCWLWQLYCSAKGYGILPRRMQRAMGLPSGRAHIAVYTFWKQQPKLFVCHKCDVPACGRPSHLWEGTNRDNQLDSYGKGRHVYRHSKTTKRKISEAHKGKKMTTTARLNMSRARKGVPLSSAHRRKMRTAQIARWQRRKGLIK